MLTYLPSFSVFPAQGPLELKPCVSSANEAVTKPQVP